MFDYFDYLMSNLEVIRRWIKIEKYVLKGFVNVLASFYIIIFIFWLNVKKLMLGHVNYRRIFNFVLSCVFFLFFPYVYLLKGRYSFPSHFVFYTFS